MKKKNKIIAPVVAVGVGVAAVLFSGLVMSCDTGTGGSTKPKPPSGPTNPDNPEPETPDNPEPEPIETTHPVSLRDGALKFDIKFMALPDAPVPEYVKYIEERLQAIEASATPSVIADVNNLANKSSQFIIDVEYTGNSFDGLVWNSMAQTFKIHHNWVSTASGTDLSISMMRNVFNEASGTYTAMIDTKAIVAQALGAQRIRQINKMHRELGLQKA